MIRRRGRTISRHSGQTEGTSLTARLPATPTRPVEVTLTSDLLAGLTARERALLRLLLDACVEMDQIFWQEAAGDRNTVLSAIEDPDIRSLVDFNYGPLGPPAARMHHSFPASVRSLRAPASIRPTWT